MSTASQPDFGKEVYAWPYFLPSSLADLVGPAMQEALTTILPGMIASIVVQEAQNAVQALAVLRAGDTMLGRLYLANPLPVQDSEAASKFYVDMKVAAGFKVQIAPAAPAIATASIGDLWWSSTDGQLYLFFQNAWVGVTAGASGGTGGPGVWDTVPLPPSTAGLFAWNGATSAWDAVPTALGVIDGGVF